MNQSKVLVSQFTQSVYEQVLNSSYRTYPENLRAKGFHKLFNFIKKSSDPLIKHNINGFTLLLPFSHNLPFILKNHPNYSSNLVRLAKCVKHKYDNMRFIDIGANIGDSVAMLRGEVHFPILCIEGEEQFLAILEKNIKLFSDVYLTKAFLGDETRAIKAVTSKKCGTAYIKRDAILTNDMFIQKLSDVLKNYPDFSIAKMVKIDTDGFDCKIIRGAIEFISKAKPVVFFEYDPFFLDRQGDDGVSVFKFLEETGYQNLLIYDNVGKFLLSTDVSNTDLIQDIHLYFSGRSGHRYCDICVFHGEDSELFQEAKKLEIQFFKRVKK